MADIFSSIRERPTLRDYQMQGRDEILACLARGRKPLYFLPTAGGKGPVIGSVADVIEAQGWEVWVFAHREELVLQLSEHLANVGVEHGIIAPWADLTDHPTQVCSIDTVRARLDQLRHRLARVRLIIIDEAHHAAMEGYERIRELCPNALFLGTTATPFRHDGKPLGTFNAEVRGPSVKELECRGYIAPIKLIAPPSKVDFSKLKRRMGDFVTTQLADAVDTDEFRQAAILAYHQHAAGLPTIAFCVDVDSAVKTARTFQAFNWSVEVMESTFKHCLDGRPGETKRRARRRCIQGLASGRYQILFTIGMAGEGTDIPVCAAGLDLRATESTQLWLQHVGRVKRLYPGKAEGLWLDLVGNWSRHGMPNADRHWSLDSGLKGLEKAVAAVRRCGRCHVVCERGPSHCPSCGRAYPRPPLAAVPEATLLNMPGFAGLTATEIAAAKYKDIVPLAETEEELRIYAAIKGYKRGWVQRMLDERAATKAYGYMQRRYA